MPSTTKPTPRRRDRRACWLTAPIARHGAGLVAIALAALLGSAGVHAAAAAAMERVIVERVLDGDTVAVRGWDQHVRLASVEAPEMSHGYGRPGQPYSIAAQRWLAMKLIGADDVIVRCVGEDRYRRPVCDFYRDALHVNRELVSVGLAWANTAQQRYLRDPSLLQVQQDAREHRRGLWSHPHPIEPWKWRSDCWKNKQCDPLPGGAQK